MRTFLLWRDAREDAPSASHVGELLRSRFEGLFETPPPLCVREYGPVRLAWIELPVSGWRAPFAQEDADGFALAIEYPLDAAAVLRERGLDCAPEASLCALAKELARDPDGCLRELTPPFSLVWCEARSGRVTVFSDGLGQAQLVQADRGELFAVTNRAAALSALDVPLEPEPVDWAARYTTGWFPLDRTGFRGIRHVGAGERFVLAAGGVERGRSDVLASWVHPGPCTPGECEERAEAALLRHLGAGAELWTRPSVGLSGGWDSRMIAACLRHLGAEFELRVRGNPARFDVIIARELARIADLPIRNKATSGLPPREPASARAAIERALLWQAGAAATKKHKTFLNRKPHLAGGVVNVMGQHGGVGKADFVTRIGAAEHPPERYEDLLLASFDRDRPSFLRPEMRAAADELIRESYRAADRYELEGHQRLHFYFLHEFTRRWGSAAVNTQTGLVVAPILNPGMIRAAYAYPAEGLPDKPFHRFVTGRLAPDWADVLYEDQASKRDIREGRLPAPELAEDQPAGDGSAWDRPRGWQKYDNRGYWAEVASSLVDEAIASDGLCASLFERRLARARRLDKELGADVLVMSHAVDAVFG